MLNNNTSSNKIFNKLGEIKMENIVEIMGKVKNAKSVVDSLIVKKIIRPLKEAYSTESFAFDNKTYILKWQDFGRYAILCRKTHFLFGSTGWKELSREEVFETFGSKRGINFIKESLELKECELQRMSVSLEKIGAFDVK